MPDKQAGKLERPPVVVVMGHVDHGKTTLLDFVRKANVADKEAGGITQTVGAYEIEHNKKKITFIDTPGHQAFNKMRSRGARMADIAILVVAADDGVNNQTKEVIEILKREEMPFVVAINKIDKNNADIDKAKRGLATAGIMLEGFGGDVSFQPISAKTGEGVDDLLDLILLTAEMEEFTYDPKAELEAYILEAKKDPFAGVTATAIIKNGTLKVKDELHTSSASGKVKGLKDFLGKQTKQLTASSPALIMGFNELPVAGEQIFDDCDKVEACAEKTKIEDGAMASKSNVISFIVKSENAGCLEAIIDAIEKLPHPDEEKSVEVIESGVGEVSDGDVKHAISCNNAYIVAYKVKISNAANNLIDIHKIKVFESEIIYKILEEIEEEFSGHKKQMVEADLEILAVFGQENPGAQIIGGKVLEGTLKKQREVDIQRRGASIGTGTITNLQQSKKETEEVSAENECGILFSSQTLIRKGDHLVQRPE